MNTIEIVTLALVLCTAGLVWATIVLGRHTKSLSNLTAELVQIEADREERTQRELKRSQITKALELAEQIRSIPPKLFKSLLQQQSTDENVYRWGQCFRQMALVAHLIEKPAIVEKINSLRTLIIDSIPGGYHVDDLMATNFTTQLAKLQDDLVPIVSAWRLVLSSNA